MGIVLLVLAANYTIHMVYELQFSHPERAIFINLSTCYLAAWLSSSALTLLLDRGYLIRRRFVMHILRREIFTVVSGGILLGLLTGISKIIGLLAMVAGSLYMRFCRHIDLSGIIVGHPCGR